MSDSGATLPPPPGLPNESQDSGKKAWWKQWWAITIGVVFVLIVVATIAGGGADDDESSDVEPPTDVPATTAAPAASEAPGNTDGATTVPPTEAPGDTDGAATVPPTEATTTTQAPVVEGPEPTCTYVGIDARFGYMQVELIFTNPLGEVNDLEVTYALLDGEGGTRFFTGTAGGLDMVWIRFPDANEQFRLSVDTREKVPSSIDVATIGCSVLAIEAGMDLRGDERATDADTCVVLGTDSSGSIQVEVTATSPYDETTKVQTWWALQASPGPVTFKTETKVVDLVGAGESFTIFPQFGVEKPGWIGDGEITCTVVGFWDQGR